MAFVCINDVDDGAPIGYILLASDKIDELNKLLRDHDLDAVELHGMFLGDFGYDVEDAFKEIVK